MEEDEPTGPEWNYVAHYEGPNKRLHYIEVARDLRHYGIERHQMSKPGEAPFKKWFEYEGLVYDDFFSALSAKGLPNVGK